MLKYIIIIQENNIFMTFIKGEFDQ